MPRLILVTGALLAISACSSAPVSPRVRRHACSRERGSSPVRRARRSRARRFWSKATRLTRVGRKGEVPLPDGASRVDLTGKTVMPAIINAHGHIGYRKGASFTVENYTRENIIDHLQRLAYHGVAAVMSMGAERELGYALRDELRASPPPNTALFLTAGRGLAMPNGGPAPPLRDAPYGVSTEAEARTAVQELRGAEGRRLRQDLGGRSRRHGAEAAARDLRGRDRRGAQERPPHRHAHLRAGRREGDHQSRHRRPCASALAKRCGGGRGSARACSGSGPNVFVILTLWSTRNEIFGRRPSWIDDPLLRETFTADEIAMLENPAVGEDAVAKWKAGVVPRGVMALKAAGVRFGLGDDTGATNGSFYFGFGSHLEMASMVEAGLTPAEAIAAATRNSAEILKLEKLGTVAAGKSADFIVLDANPLDDINNTRRISAVYLRGSAVDRAALRAKWTGAVR